MNISQNTAPIRLTVPSDDLSVRDALLKIENGLHSINAPDAVCGTAQMVLAEILNNVVEHAYASKDGEIEITLSPKGDMLFCLISDAGEPMPNNTLPEGRGVQDDTDLMDLPEGGFGWLLINEYARNLNYRRNNDKNILTFQLALSE
ncbi:MAG: ATP-binding protein [Pseudoruegeria sp.]